MRAYYTEDGTFLGQAWSTMQCRNKDDHKPHRYDSESFCFGPYFCSGFPAQPIYDSPPREPANKPLSRTGNDT